MLEFKIPASKECSIDLETCGLFPSKGDQFYCASFCSPTGETAVVSFPVDPLTRKVDYSVNQAAFDAIKEWCADGTVTKINHNIAFDIRFLEREGMKVRGPIVCTMNLIRLLKSDAPMALKPFCDKYLGIGIEDEIELKKATMLARRIGKEKGWKVFKGKSEEGSLAPDYWMAPRELVERYAVTDAIRAMSVYVTLLPEIRKNKLDGLWDQENKTWRILRAIEKRGIRVYREKVIEQKEVVKKKLLLYQKKAEQIIQQLFPVPKIIVTAQNKMKLIKVNLNSSTQLRPIFYERYKESILFLTKAGYPSTDVDALRAMKNPLAKIILSIRACNKTAEFMDQYLFFMRKHKDGCWYLHPTLHQAMARTTRESCADPNLQQVAKGNDDKGIEILVEGRSVFGPRPGYKMRSYDWKNIEVYVPGFKFKEKNLTRILLKGGDVHDHSVKAVSAIINQEISRDNVKRTYFGWQYGIGKDKLARKLGVSVQTAVLIKYGFTKAYPTLTASMQELQRQVFTDGQIVTGYGWPLRMDSEESYKAFNYYVQGTAAGILRQAKIKIFDFFRSNKWDAFIVLPIHDELLIEFGSGVNVDELDNHVVRCMQDNPELKMPIPIPVSISEIGKNWADKKKVKTI